MLEPPDLSFFRDSLVRRLGLLRSGVFGYEIGVCKLLDLVRFEDFLDRRLGLLRSGDFGYETGAWTRAERRIEEVVRVEVVCGVLGALIGVH